MDNEKEVEQAKVKTPFIQYVHTLLKDLGLEQDNWAVRYTHKAPADSWDRLYAMYVLEKRPDLLEVTFDKLNEVDMAEFYEQSIHAYNNYEREMMSNDYAYHMIMYVAKQGMDVVKTDSYDTGGWFGAS